MNGRVSDPVSGSGSFHDRAALRVIEVGPEHTDAVLGVVRRAFGDRPAVDPPSTALAETPQTVGQALAGPGGLLALRRDVPVGALLLDDSRPGLLGLRRVSVDPAYQEHGVASAMVGVAEDVGERRGLDGIWLRARAELPATVAFWRRRGYVEVDRDGPMLELGKTLWLAAKLRTADATRAFGARLAALLTAGDVLVLTGGLGAGKTTLTQGIGAGLRVRGDVTSPTFVIARVHPSLVGGPALVHVDAYRLGGTLELDDLGLDESLEQAVTVVEWGEGLAEGLTDSWLDIRLDRLDEGGAAAVAAAGSERDAPAPRLGTEARVVSVRAFGPRWVGMPLRSRLL